MRTADVIVIGAGVNGASTAFHLAKRGVGRIVVLDQRGVAAGATGKSGALVRCHYTNRPETELAYSSLEYFQNWDDLVGGDCGFNAVGFVCVAPKSKQTALEANVVMHQSVGVDAHLLKAADAMDLFPGLDLADVDVVAYEPLSGFADPHLTTMGFLRAAGEDGAEFLPGTKVTRILTNAGKVTGVETSAGPIEAPVVVFAGGAWAREVLDPLGVQLGLIPTATSVTIFRWPVEKPPAQPTVIDHAHHTWMRPVNGNSVLIGTEKGAVPGIDPDTHPDVPEQAYIELCRSKLVTRVPGMTSATMRGSWTGLIMRSPDSRPVIDHVPGHEGLYLMSGDSGSSFKTAPAIGKCLSEWIVDGQPATVDLRPFGSKRLTESTPWVDANSYSDAAQTISR